MQYILDTNICIYIAQEKPMHVLHKFAELSKQDIGMSVVTYAELLYGCQKSHDREQAVKTLEHIAEIITVLPLPEIAARRYSLTRSILQRTGKIIGNNDLWIAAHALSLDLVLVTNNYDSFVQVPSLKVENWAQAQAAEFH